MISVTLTGADDAVDPEALAILSREFPFVEWGILVSTKRAGAERYPSPSWVGMALQGVALGARFSAHLCGAHARAFCSGDPRVIPSFIFSRLQLNGYGDMSYPGTLVAAAALSKVAPGIEIILQAREEASLQIACHQAGTLPRASVLFDPSGGHGLEPFRWPRAPAGARVGFAGGIKPETIDEVIGEIAMSNVGIGDFWIDLESGVRDEADRFDLRRVREVLERVANINGRLFAP